MTTFVIMRRLVVSVALLAGVLAGCGASGSTATTRAIGASAQRRPCAAADPALSPSGTVTASDGGIQVPLDTPSVLRGFPMIAEVEVVSCDPAHDRPPGAPPESYDAANPPPPEPGAVAVSRDPIVGRVVHTTIRRAIKGSPPHDLAIDIPGGSDGQHKTSFPEYSLDYAPGDRMLVFFEPQNGSPQPDVLIVLQPDGSGRLPFGGHETVNGDNWQAPT